VTKVPATPTQIEPAAVRNRRQPICIPPSNKMTTRATDTTRWTVVTDSWPNVGITSEAAVAASRKIAGAGIRIRSLIRLDSTAAVMAAPTTSTSSAKCSTSPIPALLIFNLCLIRLAVVYAPALLARSQACWAARWKRTLMSAPPVRVGLAG
jgi:hypothetical protein